MKKYFFIFGLLLFLVPVWVSAQTNASPTPVNLPSVTITPDNPFYFLVTWGEGIQNFFTFNSEAKARLQVEFAAKRIAEIKKLLETKGINARGLDVAQARLKENLSRANDIIEGLKTEGTDVSNLAKDLHDDIEESKNVINETTDNQFKNLENEQKTIETDLENAMAAGNATSTEELEKRLEDIKNQNDSLKRRKSDIEDEVNSEQDLLEEALDIQTRAEKVIAEVQKRKQEILNEAVGEGITLSVNTFKDFDSLIAQAKSAYDAANYGDAYNFAKAAENSLETAESSLEELKANQEELNKESERETKQMNQEKQNEAPNTEKQND